MAQNHLKTLKMAQVPPDVPENPGAAILPFKTPELLNEDEWAALNLVSMDYDGLGEALPPGRDPW